MSLSSATLTAIQKVGAAAFTADEKLKNEVKEYADRVHAAISKNPYNLGNDTLIENWKVAARLSKTLAGIEAELQKVFQVASELTDADQPSVAVAPEQVAPEQSKPAPVVRKSKAKPVVAPTVVEPTAAKKASKPGKTIVRAAKKSAKLKAPIEADVVLADVVTKPKKKKTAAAKVKAVTKPAKKVATPKATPAIVEKVSTLAGNPAKLFAYFENLLNENDFTAVNQTLASQQTGIPLGSMTAAIKKLTDLGRITAAEDGGLKLVVAQPASEPTLSA